YDQLANAFLATTLCRVWKLIVLSTLWATCITLICDKVHDLSVEPALLSVYGIIVGFAISYRTSTAFERYNEGRNLWSAIACATRTFSRTVWFHFPASTQQDTGADTGRTLDKNIEEKSKVIRLVGAFSFAVKDYLRRDTGRTQMGMDLHHLLQLFPTNALQTGVSPATQLSTGSLTEAESTLTQHNVCNYNMLDSNYLPQPVTSKDRQLRVATTVRSKPSLNSMSKQVLEGGSGIDEQHELATPPPNPTTLRWTRPLSMLAKLRVRLAAYMGGGSVRKEIASQKHLSCDIPLEISFYLSSYIVALQQHDPAMSAHNIGEYPVLMETLYLTTPVHRFIIYESEPACKVALWVGAYTYAPPPLLAFFFFGFLAAGEEIENPFGTDKNDLDLDSFCNVIQAELVALTSRPSTNHAVWVLTRKNETDDPKRGGVQQTEPPVMPVLDSRFDSDLS
ncbi:hypothetical protein FRC09_009284, partial [Ceratobasidium sp. 395]